MALVERDLDAEMAGCGDRQVFDGVNLVALRYYDSPGRFSKGRRTKTVQGSRDNTSLFGLAINEPAVVY